MSMLGPTGAVHAAGLNQAEKLNARAHEAKKINTPEGRKRAADEVDVSTAQSTDAVRNLKSNGDEETADDRQEQDHYRPQKEAEEKPVHKHLDVQG